MLFIMIFKAKLIPDQHSYSAMLVPGGSETFTEGKQNILFHVQCSALLLDQSPVRLIGPGQK